MTPLEVVLPAAAGLIAGLLLLRRVPTLGTSGASHRQTSSAQPFSVIIPSRNEENNLAHLLQSLEGMPAASDVIVADDESSDATAIIAHQYGARVLSSQPLPSGWLGKTWACWQGAQVAPHDTLLFLDADTRFVHGGLQRLCDCFAALPANRVISILPFHRMENWYEQLSLFFNLLMAMGAGGFGRMDAPHMFGQCMMTPRGLYESIGGHAAVRHTVLENMQLAHYVSQAGGQIMTYGGRDALEMRMFPDGFAQLHRSWKKGFTDGARSSSIQVLALAYLYLSGCAYVLICLLTASGYARLTAAIMYLAYSIMLAWQGRQLGTFRLLTAFLYAIPLIFYFAVFAEAALGKLLGRKVSWRGRDV